MAKATSSAQMAPSVADRVREICGYLVFASATFLLIACASYVDRESADAVSGLANRCGDTGYLVARSGLFAFGYGVYLGIFTLFVWAIALVSGRSIRVNPFRMLWLGLFLFSASAFVSDIGFAPTKDLPDAGGLVGRQIAEYVELGLGFGAWGTKILLLVAALISFQLATDFILLKMVRGVRDFLVRRREQAATAMERVGPLFRSLLARDDERAAKADSTKKKKVEIAITDEEVEGFPEPRAKGRKVDKSGKLEPLSKVEEPSSVIPPPDLTAVDPADVVAAAAALVNGESNGARGKAGKGGKKPAAEPARSDAAGATALADPAPKADDKKPDGPPPKSDKKSGADKVTIDDPDKIDTMAGEIVAEKSVSPGITRLPPQLDDEATDDPDAVPSAAEAELAFPPVEPPPLLEEDLESEVVPPPKADRKQPAKIHLEPPKAKMARSAGFENETTQFVAPTVNSKFEYFFPSIGLLEEPHPIPMKEFQKMIEGMSGTLESSLRSYKVEASVVEIQKGPVITMFEINVAEGTRVDKIRALEDDLAIRLKVPSVRIVAPIPGKSTIGIEVPNKLRETVCLRELVTSPEYTSANFAIPLFLGKDAAGRPLIEDLAKMPHLLVAGATGAGKSVCLNSIIMSILFTRTPDQVKMILIDPKMVELSLFENIPHLACPVVRDMTRAAQILEWACQKMDERYELMAEVGARNIFSYNKISDEEKRTKLGILPDDETFEPKMPFVVIVIDELADLMMTSAKEVENSITRLAQKSRAVGIHVILATQRPSTNVITGLIKANLPTRISFQVASKIDSRVVLDQNGAEKLLGFGDLLYLPPRTSMLCRGQGAFVADEEIRKTVDCVKVAQPLYSRELIQREQKAEIDPRQVDDLYDDAARFVCETKRGSASLLQRRFSIGYTRASRLIDLMAEDGILGEYKNAQAREVLMNVDDYETRQQQRAEES